MNKKTMMLAVFMSSTLFFVSSAQAGGKNICYSFEADNIKLEQDSDCSILKRIKTIKNIFPGTKLLAEEGITFGCFKYRFNATISDGESKHLAEISGHSGLAFEPAGFESLPVIKDGVVSDTFLANSYIEISWTEVTEKEGTLVEKQKSIVIATTDMGRQESTLEGFPLDASEILTVRSSWENKNTEPKGRLAGRIVLTGDSLVAGDGFMQGSLCGKVKNKHKRNKE